MTATKTTARNKKTTPRMRREDLASMNQPPQIMAPGPVTTHPGRTVTGGFTAFDPEGDSITFSSSGFPSNASLSSSGVVTFSPGWTQLGAFPLTVIASDGHGGSASATWTVTVQDSPPVFQPFTPPPATPGQSYTCFFNAIDPDGDVLRWSLVSGPSGSSINAATGGFTWNVPSSQPAGTVNVTVRVEEQMNSAMSAVQTFQITVMGTPLTSPSCPPDSATYVVASRRSPAGNHQPKRAGRKPK